MDLSESLELMNPRPSASVPESRDATPPMSAKRLVAEAMFGHSARSEDIAQPVIIRRKARLVRSIAKSVHGTTANAGLGERLIVGHTPKIYRLQPQSPIAGAAGSPPLAEVNDIPRIRRSARIGGDTSSGPVAVLVAPMYPPSEMPALGTPASDAPGDVSATVRRKFAAQWQRLSDSASQIEREIATAMKVAGRVNGAWPF